MCKNPPLPSDKAQELFCKELSRREAWDDVVKSAKNYAMIKTMRAYITPRYDVDGNSFDQLVFVSKNDAENFQSQFINEILDKAVTALANDCL